MKISVALAFAATACSVAGRAISGRDTFLNITDEVIKVSPWGTSVSPFMAFNPEKVAKEEDWDKFVCKGTRLVNAIVATDEEAGKLIEDPRTPPSAASKWKGDLRSEMKTWFWHEDNDEMTEENCDLGSAKNLYNAMKDLGLSDKRVSRGGDNRCHALLHKEPKVNKPAAEMFYEVDGKKYRATGGWAEVAINTKGGAIFAFNVQSPETAAKSYSGWKTDKIDRNDLPQLRALSDLLWGLWNRDNADVKNIKYFFMIGIINVATNALMATALKKENAALNAWPGVKISMETDQGKAMLASANGATFAYFLFQHKAELGDKVITHVTIFRDDESRHSDPSLLFHVADA